MLVRTAAAVAAVAVLIALAGAQTMSVDVRVSAAARPFAAHVIVPQTRAFAIGQPAVVRMTGVEVGVVIVEQVATTMMDISLENTGYVRQEAELVVPVPDGAVVRGFTFQGAAPEAKAEVLAKGDASRIYHEIVAKVRDPALLEFAGYNLIRSSVFPVEPRGTQKVRLTYEHILDADGHRVDYVLPRSEALDYAAPWKISVRIKSKRPVATVYSPSHRIETARPRAGDEELSNIVSVRVPDEAAKEPGAFRLSYLIEDDGVTASLLAYPDPKIGGGYFLLLAGVPAKLPKGAGAIKREVTLVFDRSGSMNGGKIEQVREAALQVLAGLEPGEAFNIMVYNEAVDLFAERPVIKSDETVKRARAYLKGVQARGGTNIHDALVEALRQKPTEGMLPIVLFLTDGLPTIGQTSEVAIREVAMKANPHQRRIFTFGVGVDVNTPLLEKIAMETRATPTFVLPREDVEAKVGQVFARLAGPVLAEPKLAVVAPNGEPALGRTRDLIPSRLPDLFENDQLVLLGQYVGEEPVTFRLSGNYLGRQRTFTFRFDLAKATTRNAFVPRLWASRKIAVLIDAVRQAGADGARDGSVALTGALTAANAAGSTDPRIKELVTEIVRLSTEFGILTEYTAFLAREGTDLSKPGEVMAQAMSNFRDRAMNTRAGLGAVNQSLNTQSQLAQQSLNGRNAYFDANMNRVSIANVQQVSDRAFYQRGNQWVDSRIINSADRQRPAREVRFGSDEFRTLADRLAREGRQGTIALRGDVLMQVDGETLLIKGPEGR
jgi:Ca-activated chloride channel family protein